jgi:hypothetical protein
MGKKYLRAAGNEDMSDKKSVNLRIETNLKEMVERVSRALLGEDRPSALSTTAEKLIIIGLGAQKAGIEPQVVGPLGVLPRPFTTPSFGGEKETMGTQLRTETLEELQDYFDTKKHTAAREALLFGILIVQLDDLKLEGPLGGSRPFAELDVDERVAGDEAKQTLEEVMTAVNNSL